MLTFGIEVRLVADPRMLDSVGKATRTLYSFLEDADPHCLVLRVHPLYYNRILKEMEEDGKSQYLFYPFVYNETAI